MFLDLDRAIAAARRAVEAAAAASLPHFRRGVRVELKPDRTPVTAADRDAEAAIVAVLRDAFPGHAILGEESGVHEGDAATRWIVDPIDGTRGFTRGGSFWGPLLALEHEGEVVVGAMAMPALSESYWAARGRGAWVERGGAEPVRLQVSGIADWTEASVSLGELRSVLAPGAGARGPGTCADGGPGPLLRRPGRRGDGAHRPRRGLDRGGRPDLGHRSR